MGQGLSSTDLPEHPAPATSFTDLMLNVDRAGIRCHVCQGGGQNPQLESSCQLPEGSEGPATLGLPPWDMTEEE